MTDAAKSALPRLSRAGRSGASPAPERVLQFGAGNFLRGFVEWMLQALNRRGLFEGSVVIVEATGRGKGAGLNAQQGLYTTVLRGVRDGKVVDEWQLIECVSRVLNPYRDDSWLETAADPEIRFVVSNTTEAGIALDPADALDARPSPSFPGKLTQWLHARWVRFDGDPRRAVVLLPCELIEDNGRALRALVLELASGWGLPAGFSSWLRESCIFTSTLVDRIVTGYPADAADLCRELGYEDAWIVAAEPYHSWVIEGPPSLERELPLQAAGLNVVWTADVTPYRELKVRILNGAHTAMAVLGTLMGLETVGDCMRHPAMRAFIERLLALEIQPTLALPRQEIEAFTRSTLERFENPFLEHPLSSILLNSVSKLRSRLLGPLGDRIAATGEVPSRLCLALAALLVLYRPDPAPTPGRRDDPRVLEIFDETWSAHACDPACQRTRALTTRLLSERSLWGRDLTLLHPDLVAQVADDLEGLLKGGVAERMARLGSG